MRPSSLMKLKSDNPQLQEILASFQRDALDINIADVVVYEATTGKKLGEKLGPLTNIIPSNKLLEMFAAIYPDFKAEVPIKNITTHEEALTFARRVAVHAANKVIAGSTSEVNDLFIICELSLKDGAEETRGLLVHFLEDFQTVIFNANVDMDLIKDKMHPLAMGLWREIDEYWKAAAKYKSAQK